MGIEDVKYQVFIEKHPGEVLHTGSIWECERWVSKNGVVDTSYVIDRIDKEPKPTTRKPRKKKFTQVAEPLF